MGAVLRVRVLAEFGDDPPASPTARPPQLRSHQPYHPRVRKEKVVAARFVRNDRLVDAQAFASLKASPGARVLYDELRAHGIEHNDALRRLANRLVNGYETLRSAV